MKPLFLIALITMFGAVVKAQSTDLPKILTPDAYLQEQLASDGFKVFKLVPRGMFKDGSAVDSDNPIGIRGGGAYYSFTTSSHSYNKVPQIEFQSGEFGTGFYGLNYGFLIDLGTTPLTTATADMAELEFLTSYKPPTKVPDIRIEQHRSQKGIDANVFKYRSRFPVLVGHTYALRAIGYDEADVLIALNVVGKGDDGSLTIAWKKLAEFAKPTYERTTLRSDSSSISNP